MQITTKFGYNADNCIKIFIDDILHLSFKVANINGISSWIDGENNDKFFIQICFIAGNTMILEYDNKDKWGKILNVLNNFIR